MSMDCCSPSWILTHTVIVVVVTCLCCQHQGYDYPQVKKSHDSNQQISNPTILFVYLVKRYYSW